MFSGIKSGEHYICIDSTYKPPVFWSNVFICKKIIKSNFYLKKIILNIFTYYILY